MRVEVSLQVNFVFALFVVIASEHYENYLMPIVIKLSLH